MIWAMLVNNRKRDDEPKIEFVDVSQTITRAPHSCSEQIPTILPGSRFWSLSRQRLVTGVELMALQGLDFVADRVEMSSMQLADLAGNAFSGPTVLAVLMSAIFARKSSQEIREESNHAAREQEEINNDIGDLMAFARS